MTDDIRVEIHDGWRALILNRPEKLNAVNAAMLTRLFMLLQDEVAADLDRRIAERQALSHRTVENELARQAEINRQLADLFSRAERVQQLTAQAMQQRELVR